MTLTPDEIKRCMPKFHGCEVLTVKEYIYKHYESQRDYARKKGIRHQLVTQWIARGDIVVGHVRYYPGKVIKSGELEG